MTAEPNMMQFSNLSQQTRTSQALVFVLRNLKAGTLAVVMMVALALLDAMRATDSAVTKPALDNASMPGIATDGFSVRHTRRNKSDNVSYENFYRL